MSHIGKDVTLHSTELVHDTALLYGKITADEGVSIYPYMVMRAEIHEIRIGEHTNIQDHVMIHVGEQTPTIVGKNCSITHHVTLHGCEIGDIDCIMPPSWMARKLEQINAIYRHKLLHTD